MRVWELIYPEPNTGCWLWGGSTNFDATRIGYAYGRLEPGGKLRRMHIVTYETFVGTPQNVLDHLCRQTACVRPDHLEDVTHEENMRRGLIWSVNRSKETCPKGHPYSGDNLVLKTSKSGRVSRGCRECGRERSRAWKQRTGYNQTHKKNSGAA